MPKFNWDAFLGGAAETGLDAFRTVGSLSLLKREQDRREASTAFEMGTKIPIVRGGAGVGGLGGMAPGKLSEQAGVPEDYGAYDTPGAIGAAPGVETGMGDAESRGAARGQMAQTGGGSVDERAQQFINNLSAENRQRMMQGAEMADAEQTRLEAAKGLTDLSTALKELRAIQVGAESAEKVIQMRRTQMEHLIEAEEALYLQLRDATDPAAVQKEIHKTKLLIDQYKKDIMTAMNNRSGKEEAARVAASEVKRRSRALELLGVEPDLIENYGKTYLDDGNIGAAGNLILNRYNGMPKKAPRSTPTPRPSRPPARPLR